MICHNRYDIKVTTSVLAVGDDKLDVGDDDDTSPETAEGLAHTGGLREITWLIHVGPRVPRMFVFVLIIAIFVFYSKKQIE